MKTIRVTKLAALTILILCAPAYAMMQKAEQRLARPASSALATCTQRFFANTAAQRACQATAFGGLRRAQTTHSDWTRHSDVAFQRSLDMENLLRRKDTLSKEEIAKELRLINQKTDLRTRATDLTNTIAEKEAELATINKKDYRYYDAGPLSEYHVSPADRKIELQQTINNLEKKLSDTSWYGSWFKSSREKELAQAKKDLANIEKDIHLDESLQSSFHSDIIGYGRMPGLRQEIAKDKASLTEINQQIKNLEQSKKPTIIQTVPYPVKK